MSSDGRFTHCFFAVCLWLRFASYRAATRCVAPVCLPCYCVCNNSQSVALSHSHSLSLSLTLTSHLALFTRRCCCRCSLSQHRIYCCCASIVALFAARALALSQYCALSHDVSSAAYLCASWAGERERRWEEEASKRTSLALVAIAFYFIDPEQRCSTPTLLHFLFWLALLMLIKLSCCVCVCVCYKLSAALWPAFVCLSCCCAIAKASSQEY